MEGLTVQSTSAKRHLHILPPTHPAQRPIPEQVVVGWRVEVGKRRFVAVI